MITAAFSRGFSKLELGLAWLHPTEPVLVIVLIAALVRAGWTESLRRIRATGALVPLLVLWLFGAIATVRGLRDWGFTSVLHEIGLVEYSVLVPLLALVVRDRFELWWLARVVAFGGAAAIAVHAATAWAPESWDLYDRLDLIAAGSGMYAGLYAAWVAARVAVGVPLAAWHIPVVLLGVSLTVAAASRTAWVALLAGFVTVFLLGPSGRRLALAGFSAAVLVLGTAAAGPVTGGGLGVPAAEQKLRGSFQEPGASSTEEPGASSTEERGAAATLRWRLAFWRFLLEESTHSPAFGVGFGRPTDFQWSGRTFDTRAGDPNDPFDVTPPHNSFIALLYRTGLPGFLALAALMFLAVKRLVPVARSAHGEDRALAIWMLAALAVTTAGASFFPALEGPYMGIFFWVALGLALLAPRMLTQAGAAPPTLEPATSSSPGGHILDRS